MLKHPGSLARLQQLTTLALLSGAVLWFVIAWRDGERAQAGLGAAVILFGYALTLAAEFVLLARINRHDAAPPATRSQLLSAWLGEVIAAPRVFCWRQPFRSQRWPDHLPAAAAGRRGVVLVHGFVCNRGLWNRWMRRLHARGVPFVAVNLEPVFGSIDNYAAIIDQAVRAVERATGLPPVLVGHSMGGLAVRRWWSLAVDDGRVSHAITIGTPHHGTWLARWAFSRNGRQMQLASRWLQQLQSTDTPARAARFTCFYGHCDNIVFPASNATLAGADNRHLPAVAHVHMADRPEPFDELLRRLQAPVT
jgi:triacylglycerol esterase/lipase EstA (alpha/beta hydrolase family)